MAKKKGKKKRSKERPVGGKERKLSADDNETKELVDSCDEDGHTLCQLYLIAVIPEADQSIAKDIAADAWSSLLEDDPKGDRTKWVTNTKSLKKQTLQAAKVRLDVDGTGEIPQRLRNLALSTLENHRRLEQGKAEKQLSDGKQPAASISLYPVIDGIVGSSDWEPSPAALIDDVLADLRKRIKAYPDMAFQGRTNDYYRIDFDPEATDITSVKCRLEAMQAQDLEKREYEKLLEPIVRWNRSAFPDIKAGVSLEGPGPQPGSEWSSYRKILKDFRPLTRDDRQKLALAIVEKVRTRCKRNNEEYPLLHKPRDLTSLVKDLGIEQGEMWQSRNEQWTLWKPDEGLGAKIVAAMDEAGLSDDELQDRVEKVLFEFKAEVGKAVFGRSSEG